MFSGSVSVQVHHSQRLSETPLKCWVITESSGEICCGHCNCMAGLGEVCTHIASLLFYLEALHRLKEVETCTQRQCEWIIPSALKKVEYLPIKDIDFTSARGKKRKLDEMLESDKIITKVQVSTDDTTPTDDDMELLFKNLSLCGTTPAVLSLISEYSDKYIPKTSLPNFPQPLTSLHKAEYLTLQYHDLMDVCEKVFAEVTITDDMAKAVELETRKQHKTNLWFKYRAGRVTASRMKTVCHTNMTNPSQSLVKGICYPEAFTFTSKQTNWGCKHEKQAREIYKKKSDHTNLQVTESGLFINPLWPFIGASPDGIVNCDCCPKGVLEIKCPYCHQNESIISATVNDKKFCLREEDEMLRLDCSHQYYYQVQTQIFVCDVAYCDFCVCTFGEEVEESTHIERVYKNDAFWNDCVMKAELFFKTCLLPELLANWYTRPSVMHSENHQADQSESEQLSSQSEQSAQHQALQSASHSPIQTYCYCHGQDEGEMIGCDNEDCIIEWFHMKCLKITPNSIPKGKWYCPECRKLPQFSRSKGKGKAKSQK